MIKTIFLSIFFTLSTLLVSAQGVSVEASKSLSNEFSPQNIVDGDLSSKWITDENNGGWVLLDFGKVNPSGKLPITIEKEFSDSPAKNYHPAEGRPVGENGKFESTYLRPECKSQC